VLNGVWIKGVGWRCYDFLKGGNLEFLTLAGGLFGLNNKCHERTLSGPHIVEDYYPDMNLYQTNIQLKFLLGTCTLREEQLCSSR